MTDDKGGVILEPGTSQSLPTIDSVHLVFSVFSGPLTGQQQLPEGSRERGMSLIKYLGSFLFLD